MTQKYDPIFHNNISRNFRSLWKEVFPNAELKLSDKQIWDLNEEHGMHPAKANDLPDVENRYDANILVEMHELNQKHDSVVTVAPPEFEDDQDIRPIVEAHNQAEDLVKTTGGKAPLAVATVCIGDIVVALYAVQTPCEGNVEGKVFYDTTYELHFHDLKTGEHAHIPIRGENDALCMFATWIMQDETQRTIERCYKRMVAALGDKAKVFMV